MEVEEEELAPGIAQTLCGILRPARDGGERAGRLGVRKSGLADSDGALQERLGGVASGEFRVEFATHDREIRPIGLDGAEKRLGAVECDFSAAFADFCSYAAKKVRTVFGDDFIDTRLALREVERRKLVHEVENGGEGVADV